MKNSLLAQLLNKKGEFVSGEKISTSLGVSRVSVKKRADALVTDGYQIEAQRSIGYKLTQEPFGFHDEGIRYHFSQTVGVGIIHLFETIDSTNSEAERKLVSGENVPLFIVAKSQDSGRGRRGNKWESFGSRNLLFSLGLRPEVDVKQLGGYTLWIGQKIAEFLDKEHGVPVKVKWPNDLILEDHKLGGVLTEAKVDTQGVSHLVAGLGLNVNESMKGEAVSLESKAISLADHLGLQLEFPLFAARIMKLVYEESECFFDNPDLDQFRKNWKEYDHLFGKSISVNLNGEQVCGVASGIDENGHLLLRSEDGQVRGVFSGEVTLNHLYNQ